MLILNFVNDDIEALLEQAIVDHESLFNNDMVLIYDISHLHEFYKSLVFYKDGSLQKSYHTSQELLNLLVKRTGWSYENNKWMLQLLFTERKKRLLPYLFSNFLLVPLRNPATKYCHWLAFHQIEKRTPDGHFIFSEKLQVNWPETKQTIKKKCASYDKLLETNHHYLNELLVKKNHPLKESPHSLTMDQMLNHFCSYNLLKQRDDAQGF